MPSRVSNAIYQRLEFLRSVLQRTVREFAPSHLRQYIKVERARDGETVILRVSVNIRANPAQKYGSKDARAQEFGSGLRAQIGQTGYISIVPKRRRFLKFAGTNDWEGQTIFTQHVNSPGIPAANSGEGYIRPAIREFESVLIPQLDPTIRQAVNFEVRTWFPNAKGEQKF